MARPSASTWRWCERRQRQREALAVGAQRLDRVLPSPAPCRAPAMSRRRARGCGTARARDRRRCRRGCPARRRPPARPRSPAARTCSSALARSRSSRRSLISPCRAASACIVRIRVRNSAIAVTTPNRMTPSVRVSAASSCRSSAAKVSSVPVSGHDEASAHAVRGTATAAKAVPAMSESFSPRMRLTAPCPDRLRHVPCPFAASFRDAPEDPVAGAVRHAAREFGLYRQAESSRKSPDREREASLARVGKISRWQSRFGVSRAPGCPRCPQPRTRVLSVRARLRRRAPDPRC